MAEREATNTIATSRHKHRASDPHQMGNPASASVFPGSSRFKTRTNNGVTSEQGTGEARQVNWRGVKVSSPSGAPSFGFAEQEARIWARHISSSNSTGMASRLDSITDWETRARGVKYRVASLARSVHVTSRQLERYFSRVFTCHPKDWLKDLRRKEVARLKRRGLSDKEIADRLGVKQPSYFSRLFGRHNKSRGKPPGQRRFDK